MFPAAPTAPFARNVACRGVLVIHFSDFQDLLRFVVGACTLEHLHNFDHTWECLFNTLFLLLPVYTGSTIYRCLFISSAPQVGVTSV